MPHSRPRFFAELPMGITVSVKRMHSHVNVYIKAPQLEGGQDGLCGNFNGIGAVDSLELLRERMDPRVPPSEVLFAAQAL